MNTGIISGPQSGKLSLCQLKFVRMVYLKEFVLEYLGTKVLEIPKII